MKLSLLTWSCLGALLATGCVLSDEPKIPEGLYAAGDQSFSYPLVGVKAQGNAMQAYAVYQYACRETGGSRSFGRSGSVRPYSGGELPLTGAVTHSGNLQCGIDGQVFPYSNSEVTVEVYDGTRVRTTSSVPVARINLLRVGAADFEAKFRAFAFQMPETERRMLDESQESFCRDLLGRSCADLLAP